MVCFGVLPSFGEEEEKEKEEKWGGQYSIALRGAAHPLVTGGFRLHRGNEGKEWKVGEKGTHANLRKRNGFFGLRWITESRVGSAYTRSGQEAVVKSFVKWDSGWTAVQGWDDCFLPGSEWLKGKHIAKHSLHLAHSLSHFTLPGSRLSPVEAFGMEYRDIACPYDESGEGFNPFFLRFLVYIDFILI